MKGGKKHENGKYALYTVQIREVGKKHRKGGAKRMRRTLQKGSAEEGRDDINTTRRKPFFFSKGFFRRKKSFRR